MRGAPPLPHSSWGSHSTLLAPLLSGLQGDCGRDRWLQLGAPRPLAKGGPALEFSVCLFHSLGFVHPSVHGQKWGQCVSESRSIYGNKTSFFLDQQLSWSF